MLGDDIVQAQAIWFTVFKWTIRFCRTVRNETAERLNNGKPVHISVTLGTNDFILFHTFVSLYKFAKSQGKHQQLPHLF